MKKWLLALLSLLLMISLLPVPAAAVTPLDLERECSMTLHYTQEGIGFPDLDISVYQVAKAQPDGTFYLALPFSQYPVNIYGIKSQREWDVVATTYKAYIIANRIPATKTGKTGADGTVMLEKLEPGLYLVMGVTAENNSGIYEFNTFMIYVPTPSVEGTYDYDVEAVPKCIHRIPKEEYRVVKLWKDSGYTASRPKEVTVEIYKDGVLWKTVALNTANNWTYTWRVPENQDGKWTVTENKVPSNYTVTVAEANGTFTVTNTRKAEPSSPPKTGDMYPLWPAVLTMCISGSLLVILGIYWLRKRK